MRFKIQELTQYFTPEKLKLHFKYLHKILFSRASFTITINNTEIVIRPRTFDLYVVAEIFGEKAYEINLDQNPEFIVDLGANIGAYTLYAATKYQPKKVLSVEMDSENFHILEKNISLNRSKFTTSFITVNTAVSNKIGEVSYEKTPLNYGKHTISDANAKYKVKSTTLSQLLDDEKVDKIDLIKIDIEGSEKYLLNEENKEIFKNKVKNLVMELHINGKDITEVGVREYFESIGFECSFRNGWNDINPLFYAIRKRD